MIRSRRCVGRVGAAEGVDDQPGCRDHRNATAAALDEADGGPHLGPHAPGRELPRLQVPFGLGGVHPGQRALGLLAEVELDGVHAGDEHQRLGLQLVGELGGGVVLVDDGVHAVPDVPASTHGDPATAAGDHDMAGVQQAADRVDLDESLRLG